MSESFFYASSAEPQTASIIATARHNGNKISLPGVPVNAIIKLPYMIRKVFPVLAVCVFTSTLGIGIVSPLLPLYINELGATDIWLGIIVAAYFFSNSITVPIAGRLSDKKGRKLFLTIGLFAYSVISLGYLIANTAGLLTLVRLVHGIAGAVTIPVAVAYIGDLSPESEEGKWMGYANAAFFSGFGFGPLLGGVLSEHLGMNAAFLTMSGLNMVAFFISLFALPEVRVRREEEGFNLSFKEMSDSALVRGLFSYRITEALGRGGLATFLPIFAAGLGMNISLIGVLISANILSITLFAPLAGLAADRINRRILTILGVVGFSFLLVIMTFAVTFWQLMTVLLFQGLVSAFSMAASTAIGVEEGRRFGMGSTMSVLFLAMGIGMAIGPVMAGGIAEALDTKSVFYVAAAIGLFGITLFGLFTRTPAGKPAVLTD